MNTEEALVEVTEAEDVFLHTEEIIEVTIEEEITEGETIEETTEEIEVTDVVVALTEEAHLEDSLVQEAEVHKKDSTAIECLQEDIAEAHTETKLKMRC